MNRVKRAAGIDHVDDLHEPIALATAYDQSLLGADPARVRPPDTADDPVDLRDRAAVAGGVLGVPVVPPEFHAVNYIKM